MFSGDRNESTYFAPLSSTRANLMNTVFSLVMSSARGFRDESKSARRVKKNGGLVLRKLGGARRVQRVS